MKKSPKPRKKDLLSNISWANVFVLNGQKLLTVEKLLMSKLTIYWNPCARNPKRSESSVQEKKTDIGRTNIICRNLPVLLHGFIWSCSAKIIMNEKEHSPFYLR